MDPEPQFPCRGRVGGKTFERVVAVDRLDDGTLVVYHYILDSDYDSPATHFVPACTFWVGGKRATITIYDVHELVEKRDDDDGPVVGVRYIGRRRWHAHHGSFDDPNWCIPGYRGFPSRRFKLLDCTDVPEFERLGPIVPNDDPSYGRFPPAHFPVSDWACRTRLAVVRYVLEQGCLSPAARAATLAETEADYLAAKPRPRERAPPTSRPRKRTRQAPE